MVQNSFKKGILKAQFTQTQQSDNHLPKRVQNRAPSTGSGRDANSALNLPTVPSSSMKAAPY